MWQFFREYISDSDTIGANCHVGEELGEIFCGAVLLQADSGAGDKIVRDLIQPFLQHVFLAFKIAVERSPAHPCVAAYFTDGNLAERDIFQQL